MLGTHTVLGALVCLRMVFHLARSSNSVAEVALQSANQILALFFCSSIHIAGVASQRACAYVKVAPLVFGAFSTDSAEVLFKGRVWTQPVNL